MVVIHETNCTTNRTGLNLISIKVLSEMNPEAMKPYGLALSDYDKGNLSATLIIYRDDGRRDELPMSTFFRQSQEYDLERTALDLCYSHVLDIGAGIGIHTLFLQERDVPVCAIDVSPEAVQIMRRRGVCDVCQADILSLEDGEFDTVIMIGHGIGVVENIRGLVSFLEHVPGLLKANGQILLTSLDVRVTNDPTHLGVLSLSPTVYFPRVFLSDLTVPGSRVVDASALSFSYPAKLFQDSLAVGDTAGNLVQWFRCQK